MLISHSKRFVFLANPKTGSVSMHDLLRPHAEVESPSDRLPAAVREASGLHYHIVAADILTTFANRGWDWGAYFSFTMIRNPWDRIVSAYEYGRRKPGTFAHRRVTAAGSFERFARDTPVRPIERHAFDHDGRQLVSEIIRLEDVASAIPRILENSGFPKRRFRIETRECAATTAAITTRRRGRWCASGMPATSPSAAILSETASLCPSTGGSGLHAGGCDGSVAKNLGCGACFLR